MKPITFTAIVAALSAGVASSAGKAVENTLVETYQGLITILKSKSSDHSDVVEVANKPEQKPNSEARRALLQEDLEVAGGNEAPDIRQATQHLLEQFEIQSGEQHSQHGHSSYIAQSLKAKTAL